MMDCTDEPDPLCRLHFTSVSYSLPVRGAKCDQTQQIYEFSLPKVSANTDVSLDVHSIIFLRLLDSLLYGYQLM